MTTRDRKLTARQRARQLQEAERARLKKLELLSADVFNAMDGVVAAKAVLGERLQSLIDNGMTRKQIGADFGMPAAEVREALAAYKDAAGGDDVSDSDPASDEEGKTESDVETETDSGDNDSE